MNKDITNLLKIETLKLIKSAGSGDAGLALSNANLFKLLFCNHLNYDINNPNWINRDRLIVSNRFTPLLYKSLELFKKTIKKDELEDFKMFGSKLNGYANKNVLGVDVESNTTGDVIPLSVGVALGERYLSNLLKLNNKKNNVIDFYTYVVCNLEDLVSGLSYEGLSFAQAEDLKKLIILCNVDEIAKDSSIKETFIEDLEDRFDSIGFDVIEVKNGLNESSLDNAILDAKDSKRATIILYNTVYGKDSIVENSNTKFNKPIDDINSLIVKYKLDKVNVEDLIFKNDEKIDKRLNKIINKWKLNVKDSMNDEYTKEVYELLTNQKLNVNYSMENIKLNESYKEELVLGNHKIFNIFAQKNPFILSGSDDNFIYTKMSINKSDLLTKDNPLGRNILFGNRTEIMGYVAGGLSHLGFKVFISSVLVNSTKMIPSIIYNSKNKNKVHYVFTKISMLDSYLNYGINPYNEINILRNIKDLITFVPSDITEVIGTYEILKNYNGTTCKLIHSEEVMQLENGNSQYVLAGAYRVRKERDMLNAIIISSGELVKESIDIADELSVYGIDFRVVSMPSLNLFLKQSEKYQNGLIPKNCPVFVLDLSDKSLWYRFTSDDKIFGINEYQELGTKQELLKNASLDKDSVKAKIIEILKQEL